MLQKIGRYMRVVGVLLLILVIYGGAYVFGDEKTPITFDGNVHQTRGFLIKSESRDLEFYDVPEGIQISVNDNGDLRGIYCEIRGNIAGEFNIPFRTSSLEGEIHYKVVAPILNVPKTLNLQVGQNAGFLITPKVQGMNIDILGSENIALEKINEADPRGVYLEAKGLSKGNGTLALLIDGVQYNIDFSIQGKLIPIAFSLKEGTTGGFLIPTNKRQIQFLGYNSKELELKVVNTADPRGVYCEAKGLKPGNYQVKMSDGNEDEFLTIDIEGTAPLKPQIDIPNIVLEESSTKGFIIATNLPNLKPVLSLEDEDLGDIKTINYNDPRGIYLEITASRAGETNLIAELDGQTFKGSISIREAAVYNANEPFVLSKWNPRGFLLDKKLAEYDCISKKNISSLSIHRDDPRGLYIEVLGIENGDAELLFRHQDEYIKVAFVVRLKEMDLSKYITTYHSPNFGYDRGTSGQNDVQEIIIHHWGNPGQSFMGVVNWLCRDDGDSSAHFVVEDGKIACLIDPNDSAWHAGNYYVNNHSIGIECRPEMSEGDLETVCSLVADIYRVYGVLPIRGHRDVYATYCPGKYYTKLDYIKQRAIQLM